MEPSPNKIRYKVLLDKCQVTKVGEGELGTSFSAITPRGMTIKADLSFHPDIKVGDVLSIYTEILGHALTYGPSIQ